MFPTVDRDSRVTTDRQPPFNVGLQPHTLTAPPSPFGALPPIATTMTARRAHLTGAMVDVDLAFELVREAEDRPRARKAEVALSVASGCLETEGGIRSTRDGRYLFQVEDRDPQEPCVFDVKPTPSGISCDVLDLALGWTSNVHSDCTHGNTHARAT